MVPVTIFLKCDFCHNFNEVQALKINAENVDSFEYLDTYFIAKLKEHLLAIPREHFKQVYKLYEIIKQ